MAFFCMFFIALVSVSVIAVVWFADTVKYFKVHDSEFISSHKAFKKKIVKSRVLENLAFIQVQKSRVNSLLETEIKKRTATAWNIAQSIHKNNKGSLAKDTLKGLVTDALRNIRFFNGRGYYFAVAMNGTDVLYPVRPQLEGTDILNLTDANGSFVIKKELALIKTRGEGFIEALWSQPGPSGTVSLKRSYIKYFEPFDWYLGCGEYLESFETDVQKSVLAELSGIGPGNDSYLFVLGRDGTFLMHPVEKELVGQKIQDVYQENGKELMQQMAEAAGRPDGGFVSYDWIKPSTARVTPKLSYLKAIPDWGWIIGSGIYLDDIDAEIAVKKSELNQALKDQLVFMLLFTLILTLLVFIIAKIISIKARRSFYLLSHFFEKAASESVEIDITAMHYKEFVRLATLANKMVAEQKEMDGRLKESEKQFRILLDTTPSIAVQGYNLDLTVDYWNRASELLYGYTRQEAVGKSLLDLIIPDGMRDEVKEVVSHGLKTGEMPDIEELLLKRKDGSLVPVLSSHAIVRSKGRPLQLYCMDADLSEIKKAHKEQEQLQEKLARNRKMEALGLLAGGVAHDLNNILSGIVSYPELLLLNEGLDSETRSALVTIHESGQKAAAVVGDLITIARGVAASMEPLSLNQVVRDYLRSPEHAALVKTHPYVVVKDSLDETVFNVSGSRVHINKVIMNLVTNGVEAVLEQPDPLVDITTWNTYVDRPLRGYDEVSIGEYSVMSVTDNGLGISDQDLERIFEPFYTKKIMGRSGTGLGLTVVWNTLQDHSGYINITSNGSGTTFDLYFPAVRDDVSQLTREIADLDLLFGNQEKILVVDDEPSQRKIAVSILKKLNYRADAVETGAAAVDYIRQQGADLILLDMIMKPGMNGRETYEKILAVSPGQKAVIASGFSESEDVKKALDMGAACYLKKPYSITRLGRVLKEELGS